jgi:hypothetical protein
MAHPHASGSTENEYDEREPLLPDMGGPPPGRLRENEPVEDCSEREPVGVKLMEGRLGVSDVELTMSGGTVISDDDDEEEDEVVVMVEHDAGAAAIDCCPPVVAPAAACGGTDGAVMSACRSSSWNYRKLEILASSSEIDCFLSGGCRASPSEPELATKESLRFLVNM